MDPLIVEIARLRDQAGRQNRWKTLHALKEAQRVAGWELAEILTRKTR